MLRMETIKKLFEALLSQDTELAYCRYVSKHLAKVYLYELTGEDALAPIVLEKLKLMKKLWEIELKQVYYKPFFVVSTIRTANTQAGYKAQGRTTPGPRITDAGPLESYHNFGLAFDINFGNYRPTAEEWQKIGEIGESLGFEWGGRWADTSMGKDGDRPHFQWTAGGKITWKALKSYIETGKI